MTGDRVPTRPLDRPTCWRTAGRAITFAIAGILLGAYPPASAQTFTVLYSFTRPGDAAAPEAGVIGDSRGNLYGTTRFGGAFDYGTVFKLGPNGKDKVLHSFTGGDGWEPSSGLILDAENNLYGTTVSGGTPEGGGCLFGCGTVFKVDRAGKLTVLHAFKDPAGSPTGRLVRDGAGNLYGAAAFGYRVGCGYGMVFMLDTTGKETVLHCFTGPPDGTSPNGGLIRDASGNLYGTTNDGGDATCYCGTVFEISRDGKETILYTFTGQGDGEGPVEGLVRDADGNLYGIADGGSDHPYGIVFKLDKAGKETVLYSFTGGSAGAYPTSLAGDETGNLYGTTLEGGGSGCYGHGCGNVFKLDPAGKLTVLYSFTGAADGTSPIVRWLGPDGSLYGTAEGGGGNSGVVFKLTP
jgi:uncharacterized repeat protein (TIGR03803 family)